MTSNHKPDSDLPGSEKVEEPLSEHPDGNTEKSIATTAENENLVPSGSIIERTLYLNKSDRTSWILALLTMGIIFASFHYPLRWMLKQWFRVEEYSPGPLVPILIVVILWSKIKYLKSRPAYPRKLLIVLLVVLGLLAGTVYVGKELPKLRNPASQVELKSEDKATNATQKGSLETEKADVKDDADAAESEELESGEKEPFKEQEPESDSGTIHRIKVYLFGIMPVIGPWLDSSANIAFDIIFFVLTAFMVYAAYLFVREQKLYPVETDGIESRKAAIGMLAIVGALVLHFLGMRGDLNRISIFSFIVLMYGFIWFVFGKAIGKKMMFPFAFLMFIVPMDFLDDFLGGPLRRVATDISVMLMKGIGAINGMEVVQKGTKFLINGDPFDVAPACSGLRSLVALSAIGSAYAFITQPTILRKWLLGFCSIPIAVITNVIRLVMVGVTCHYFNTKSALWVHDNAIFLYILAILFLFSLDKIFDKVAKSKWLKEKLKWLKIKDF